MINRAGLLAIAPATRLCCAPRQGIVRWLIDSGAPGPSDILVGEWEGASESIRGEAGGGAGRWWNC